MTPKLVSTNVPSADDSKSSLLNVLVRSFVWDPARFTRLLGYQLFGDFLHTPVAPPVLCVGPGFSVVLRVGLLFVGADDLLPHIVELHVLLAELNRANTIDLSADFQRLHQAKL